MHDIGAKTPEIGADLAAFGVQAHDPRQRQQHQRLFQCHLIGLPALWQARTIGFFVIFRRLAALHIRAKAARAQADVIASLVLAQNPVASFGRIAADGAGVAAFGVIATAHETAAARGFQMQLARAAQRATAGVGAIVARGVERGRQSLV